MKKIMIMMAAAGLAGCSTSVDLTGKGIELSGVNVERTFDCTDFREVKVSGMLRVEVRTGGTYGVTLSGDSVLAAQYTVECRDGVLTVGFTDDHVEGRDLDEKNYPLASISLPELKNLSVAGMCSASLTGNVAPEASISISGMSELKAANDLSAKSLTVSAAGMSTLKLKSLSAEQISLSASGESDCTADSVVSSRAELKSDGMSDVSLAYVKSDRADATSAGMSDMKIKELYAAGGTLTAAGMSDLIVKKSSGDFTTSSEGMSTLKLM